MKINENGKNMFLNRLYFSCFIFLLFPILSCMGKGIKHRVPEAEEDNQKYISISDISDEEIKNLLKTKPKKPALKKENHNNKNKKKVVFNEDINERAKY